MKIYQIKFERDFTGVKYQCYDRARIMGIDPDAYDLVYQGEIKGLDDIVDIEHPGVLGWTLEAVFINLNLLASRPEGYKGHSLSVSDVIVLNGVDGREHAYYVDAGGFRSIIFDTSRARGCA